LVFASSSEVYGRSFAAGIPLDETALLSPRNTYAATKAAADLALGALTDEGLRSLRLRLFNHTGAGQSPQFVLAAFARQIARIERGLQEPVLRVGALSPRRDFLDVRDVCSAYIACLRRLPDLPSGQILNVASGIARRISDILDSMLRLAGVDAVVETAESRLRTGDTPIAVGDAARAKTLLGWEPTVSWEGTLKAVLDDWRTRVLREA